MLEAIRERVTVKPGGRIELIHLELPSGSEAEIIVLVERPTDDLSPLASYSGRGKGCFSTAPEIDSFVQEDQASPGEPRP